MDRTERERQGMRRGRDGREKKGGSGGSASGGSGRGGSVRGGSDGGGLAVAGAGSLSLVPSAWCVSVRRVEID